MSSEVESLWYVPCEEEIDEIIVGFVKMWKKYTAPKSPPITHQRENEIPPKLNL